MEFIQAASGTKIIRFKLKIRSYHTTYLVYYTLQGLFKWIFLIALLVHEKNWINSRILRFVEITLSYATQEFKLQVNAV